MHELSYTKEGGKFMIEKINLKNKKLLITSFSIIAFIIFSTVFISKSYIYEDKNYVVNRLNREGKLQNINSKMSLNNLKIIAHRGVCIDEPENTITSIKSSIKHNVDYAEIDVQQTKDGVIVLMHDRNLRRLTGINTTVDRLTYDQLKTLRVREPFKSHYKPEKIPTLQEVIKLTDHKRKLIIEIKDYSNTKELTKKVVSIIQENNFIDQCMVQSMSYSVIKQVKEENPKIITGYISSRRHERLPTVDVDFYSINEKNITEDMVKNIHAMNKTIYAWTVNDVMNMDKMIGLNVDGIITDKPTILLDIKKAKIHKI